MSAVLKPIDDERVVLLGHQLRNLVDAFGRESERLRCTSPTFAQVLLASVDQAPTFDYEAAEQALKAAATLLRDTDIYFVMSCDRHSLRDWYTQLKAEFDRAELYREAAAKRRGTS